MYHTSAPGITGPLNSYLVPLFTQLVLIYGQPDVS